jgi:hypothetical protein
VIQKTSTDCKLQTIRRSSFTVRRQTPPLWIVRYRDEGVKDKMVIALLQRLFESFRTKKQARPSWGRMAATSQPSNIEDMDYFEFMYQETPGMKED